MAPESLTEGKFSVKSDVWSFAVLIWEIMTIGGRPYEGKCAQDVKEYVCNNKGHLEMPKRCPSNISSHILQCWSYNPEDRPCFSVLYIEFKDLLDNLKEKSHGVNVDSPFLS